MARERGDIFAVSDDRICFVDEDERSMFYRRSCDIAFGDSSLDSFGSLMYLSAVISDSNSTGQGDNLLFAQPTSAMRGKRITIWNGDCDYNLTIKALAWVTTPGGSDLVLGPNESATFEVQPLCYGYTWGYAGGTQAESDLTSLTTTPTPQA